MDAAPLAGEDLRTPVRLPSGRPLRRRARAAGRGVSSPPGIMGIGLLIGVMSLPTPALSPREVLKKAAAAASALSSFQADFEQSLFPSNLASPYREKGRVIYQKPGRMRWEYTEPKDERKTYVYDNGLLLSYFPADNQLVRRTIPEDEAGAEIFALLSGRGDIEERYEVEASPFPGGDGPSHQLKLTPKDKEGETSYILVEIDARTFFLRKAVLFDWAGNKNEMDFLRWRPNPRLPPNAFIIDVPPDCEIIDDAPPRKR
ncbi:MAG: outer membrane lipoprotein carrier protein LolA [Candidatus Aminicenantes bacterium]|nr:outer membrane lipoprotein carrier protein LolA [Candidatus Aminicenantes bacterium]